jgi:hypothetical protein
MVFLAIILSILIAGLGKFLIDSLRNAGIVTEDARFQALFALGGICILIFVMGVMYQIDISNIQHSVRDLKNSVGDAKNVINDLSSFWN